MWEPISSPSLSDSVQTPLLPPLLSASLPLSPSSCYWPSSFHLPSPQLNIAGDCASSIHSTISGLLGKFPETQPQLSCEQTDTQAKGVDWGYMNFYDPSGCYYSVFSSALSPQPRLPDVTVDFQPREMRKKTAWEALDPSQFQLNFVDLYSHESVQKPTQ